MTTGYPGALDDLDEGTRPGLTHGDVADSVEAIQATLGVNPQGSEPDVAARLAALESGGGESAMVVVNHGADANAARPSGAAAVYWIGTVEPVNALDHDLWAGGA